MALFEIYGPFGQKVMYTNDKSCIPDADIMQAMAGAGYKFKMDGKAYKPPKKETKKRSSGTDPQQPKKNKTKSSGTFEQCCLA